MSPKGQGVLSANLSIGIPKEETFLTTKINDNCLNDLDVEGVMILVRQEYPHVGSIQDTCFGTTWEFSKPSKRIF